MDRAAVLEDLKEWLQGFVKSGALVPPQMALDKIDELEELYE